MKLKDLTISGVGGIKSLKVNFKPDMNIICGPNGIGKSTLLLAASLPFFYGVSIKVKKNIDVEQGSIHLVIEDENNIFEQTIAITNHQPREVINFFEPVKYAKRKLVRFEVNRHFDYQALASINADKTLGDEDVSHQLNYGVNLNNIKDWFAKRVLFENVEPGYHNNILKNLELAKKCISILNPEFSFSRVDPASFDVFVNTPTGEIWYEYLSSGFKSCMSLMLGIMKEIELRFPQEYIYAPDFDGVILIDELELHLHPDWQARISDALTSTFPCAQFIVTTHSPHVVQNAKADQIIALCSEGNGSVTIRNTLDNGFGFSAWSIEEVLLDVMGMESTLSSKLQEQLNAFDKFVDEENFSEAQKIYDYLDNALHQNSVLRKSLKISLMSIRERN